MEQTMHEIAEQMSEHIWTIMKEKSLEALGREENNHKEHEAIFRAVKNRDPKGATQAMLRHLRNIESSFLQK